MNDSTSQQMEFQFPVVQLCECGCGNPAPIAKVTDKKRGWIKGQPTRFIRGHYSRVRTEIPIEIRFWKFVDKSGGPDACFLWTGHRNNKGYGVIGINKRSSLAHRVCWELHFGPIPEHNSYHGMCVLHKCDNGAGGCVNPSHLFLGTNSDNMSDKKSKDRGIPGERHPSAKLTEEIVALIRKRCANGERQIDIAKEYGVSQTTISAIARWKLWRNVT